MLYVKKVSVNSKEYIENKYISKFLSFFKASNIKISLFDIINPAFQYLIYSTLCIHLNIFS